MTAALDPLDRLHMLLPRLSKTARGWVANDLRTLRDTIERLQRENAETTDTLAESRMHLAQAAQTVERLQRERDDARARLTKIAQVVEPVSETVETSWCGTLVEAVSATVERATATEARCAALEAALRALLACPEISDTDSADWDEETHVAERNARRLLSPETGSAPLPSMYGRTP